MLAASSINHVLYPFHTPSQLYHRQVTNSGELRVEGALKGVPGYENAVLIPTRVTVRRRPRGPMAKHRPRPRRRPRWHAWSIPGACTFRRVHVASDPPIADRPIQLCKHGLRHSTASASLSARPRMLSHPLGTTIDTRLNPATSNSGHSAWLSSNKQQIFGHVCLYFWLSPILAECQIQATAFGPELVLHERRSLTSWTSLKLRGYLVSICLPM
jgi:hypothetical protein